MKVKLRGHKARRDRVMPTWMKMKKMYDENVPVAQILDKVRKPDGQKYADKYFYKIMRNLKTI